MNTLRSFFSWVIRGKSPSATHVLLLPISGWLTLFLAIPLILLLVLSFTDRGAYGAIQWSGFSFRNYLRVLNPEYFPVLLRTLLFASFSTFLCLLLGYPLAYYVSFFVSKHKNIFC
ncbi:MAG: hypothetical protein HY399_04525, partial [Elusimicrobia bacterium]|nr:hypothetical protein [Elusimicrobiota bacterium]